MILECRACFFSGATPRHGPKSNLLTGGDKQESKFIYDYVASASIVQNGAGVETSRSRLLTATSFANFLKTQQGERKTEAEILAIIEVRYDDCMFLISLCNALSSLLSPAYLYISMLIHYACRSMSSIRISGVSRTFPSKDLRGT